jgi:pyruvate,water dikinase
MTLTQVWGLCSSLHSVPLLGGLPLISWITYALTRRQLARLERQCVSLSGFLSRRDAGLVSGGIVGSGKGNCAVLLARYFFPTEALGADCSDYAGNGPLLDGERSGDDKCGLGLCGS